MATDGDAASDRKHLDASLKGKGGANAVFEYKNKNKTGKNTVLRIRTRPVNSVNHLHSEQERALEAEVWQDLTAATGDFQSLEADVHYIEKLLLPIIGPQYIAPQTITQLNELEADLYGSKEGVLMPDATLLHPPAPTYICKSPVICIELKPKFGSITQCPTITPEDTHLKHSTSRYQLHQKLKSEEGSVAKESEYDPIDLFSGCSQRIEKALTALMNSPQNNLSLFIDGQRVYLEDDQNEIKSAEVAKKQLNAAGVAPMSEEIEVEEDGGLYELVDTLRYILQQEEVLEGISKAQKTCLNDIEGIYQLYCHLIGEDVVPVVEKKRKKPQENESAGTSSTAADKEQHKAAVKCLLSLPRTKAIQVLRDYSISTTAKDCSIMIAMQRLIVFGDEDVSQLGILPRAQGNGQQELLADGECDEGCLYGDIGATAWIRYRVTVVDLDRKPLAKIRKHYDLDKRIIAAARRRRGLETPL